MLEFWFSFYQNNYNKTERSVKIVYEHRREQKDSKEFKEKIQSKVCRAYLVLSVEKDLVCHNASLMRCPSFCLMNSKYKLIDLDLKLIIYLETHYCGLRYV